MMNPTLRTLIDPPRDDVCNVVVGEFRRARHCLYLPAERWDDNRPRCKCHLTEIERWFDIQRAWTIAQERAEQLRQKLQDLCGGQYVSVWVHSPGGDGALPGEPTFYLSEQAALELVQS